MKVNVDSGKSCLNFVVSKPFSSKSLNKSEGLLRITSVYSLNLASDCIHIGRQSFPESKSTLILKNVLNK